MKYVMFEVSIPSGGRTLVLKVPVVFPDKLVHSMMAEYVRRGITRSFGDGSAKPVSAGFVHLDVKNVGGESETLGLKSNPDDAMLIAMADYQAPEVR